MKFSQYAESVRNHKYLSYDEIDNDFRKTGVEVTQKLPNDELWKKFHDSENIDVATTSIRTKSHRLSLFGLKKRYSISNDEFLKKFVRSSKTAREFINKIKKSNIFRLNNEDIEVILYVYNYDDENIYFILTTRCKTKADVIWLTISEKKGFISRNIINPLASIIDDIIP